MKKVYPAYLTVKMVFLYLILFTLIASVAFIIHEFVFAWISDLVQTVTLLTIKNDFLKSDGSSFST